MTVHRNRNAGVGGVITGRQNLVAVGMHGAPLTRIAADVPSLLVDPRRLAQALGNLLANAMKFTPELGTVRLRAQLRTEGGVALVVEDSGIGMAPETIAAALEPFRQLDGSLARKFEGAGLGLSITKALVELHGGRLAIASAVGAGTTVTMTLPASRVTYFAPQMRSA